MTDNIDKLIKDVERQISLKMLETQDIRVVARAAVLATLQGVRKPSEDMITASSKINGTDKPGDPYNYRRRKRAYWQAMIDTLISGLKVGDNIDKFLKDEVY